jgi:nickel transport protein
VAFVPDVPGKWRVRVIDGTGHGLDVEVDAEAPRGAPAGESPSAGATSPVAFVLRPLLGLAVIGIVFAALVLVHRRKGAKP